MIRRINFYSICFAFGLSVLLILAGSRYTDNTNYHPSFESRRNIRFFIRNQEEYGEDISPQPLPTNMYDGSPDIEKILDNTRDQIRLQLNDYNFSYSGVETLDDLLMESNGQPMRSIIISTWRSGTTFLGEVLNAMPGTFYHYEPLLNYGIKQIRGSPLGNEAVDTIKNMLRCDFEDMTEYFEYGKTHLHQFSHNTRIWDHYCRYKKELCFDANFTGRFCKLFPFQSMKVVRLRLRLVQDILNDKSLNVKVILLVRDPRGVLQSRQHREWCLPAPDCWRPDLLCADMISDYVAAGRLMKQFPDKLLVLRYEELALDPNSTTLQVYKFLKMSLTPEVDEFLHYHTSVEVDGVSSTYRVSKDVPFRWKTLLDFRYVDEIQGLCGEAMALWGYAPAHNASHLAGRDFSPLRPYSIQ